MDSTRTATVTVAHMDTMREGGSTWTVRVHAAILSHSVIQ